MDSRKRLLFSAIIVLLSIPAPAQERYSTDKGKHEKRVRYPNTNVTFIPPPGFRQPESSKGARQTGKTKVFIQKSTASSLLIFEIPGISYHLYKDTLNSSYFRSQNLTLIKKEKKIFSGQEGYLIECTFQVKSHTFHRLMYITGNLNKTVLFLVNYPVEVKSEIKQPIYESIRSLQYATMP